MQNFRLSRSWGMAALAALAASVAGCSSHSPSTLESADALAERPALKATEGAPTGVVIAREPANSAQAFTIGAVLPLKGINAAAGLSMQRGLDLAVADVNAAGGVNGQPLVLEVADDQGGLDAGTEALGILRDRHVTLLLVGDASVAVANAEALGHFPQLVGFMCDYVTGPKLTPSNGVRIYLNGDQEARAMESYILASGVSRTAILHQNELFGESQNRYLLFLLKGDENVYTHDEGYSADDHDFNLLAQAMQRVNNGALILAGAGPEYARILAAFDAIGWKGLIFGYASQGGLKPMAGAPGLAAQAMYPVPGFAADPRSTEAGRAFADKYRAAYGEEPDLPAAYAYDNIRALAAAANQAASKDPAKIRQSFLSQQTYVGAVGRYEIKDDGDTEMPLQMVYANGQPAPAPSKTSTSPTITNIRPADAPALPGLVQP